MCLELSLETEAEVTTMAFASLTLWLGMKNKKIVVIHARVRFILASQSFESDKLTEFPFSINWDRVLW